MLYRLRLKNRQYLKSVAYPNKSRINLEPVYTFDLIFKKSYIDIQRYSARLNYVTICFHASHVHLA